MPLCECKDCLAAAVACTWSTVMRRKVWHCAEHPPKVIDPTMLPGREPISCGSHADETEIVAEPRQQSG